MKKLCSDCYDERAGLDQVRRATYGVTCDKDRRMETDNPVGAPAYALP